MRSVDARDREEVRRIVAGSGSSFYWPMRVLGREKRNAMYALYALCRLLDDIADNDGISMIDRRQQLAMWRAEIDAAFVGRPETATGRCLADAIDRFNLPRVELEELVAGMEMDADGPIVAPEAHVLTLYCRRVAGTVGQLSLHIFGRTDPDAVAFGLNLAEALQLTNILRDVAEDAERGRLYLPADLLRKYGLPTDSARAAVNHPALPAAREELAQRARLFFDRAADHLAKGGRRRLLPALMMMAVYRRILVRLSDRGWHSLTPRVRLSGSEKAAILLRQLLPFSR